MKKIVIVGGGASGGVYKRQPYEYTAIAYDELPPTVRAEVRNGKYIESPEELYGFLENYSS